VERPQICPFSRTIRGVRARYRPERFRMCAEYVPSSLVDKRSSVRHLPVPNRWRWITTGTLSAHAAYPSTAETVPPTRRCRRSRSETVRACEVAVTVNVFALDTGPAGVVTEILPVDAPAGTVAVIFVEEFTVNIADVPANFTAVAPMKFVPLTVTTVPTGPLVGDKDEIVGLAAHEDGAAAIVTPRTKRTTTVLGRSMLRDRDIDAS
jgi:hypothetical protein